MQKHKRYPVEQEVIPLFFVCVHVKQAIETACYKNQVQNQDKPSRKGVQPVSLLGPFTKLPANEKSRICPESVFMAKRLDINAFITIAENVTIPFSFTFKKGITMIVTIGNTKNAVKSSFYYIQSCKDKDG